MRLRTLIFEPFQTILTIPSQRNSSINTTMQRGCTSTQEILFLSLNSKTAALVPTALKTVTVKQEIILPLGTPRAQPLLQHFHRTGATPSRMSAPDTPHLGHSTC